MKRALSILLFLLAFAGMRNAAAEQVANLYEAEVPVLNQSAEVRALAFRAAFEVVLVKVSGYGGVLAEPALAEALRAPERYVQQFRYREQPGTSEGSAPELVFWALFDSSAVNELLRGKRLPVWGAVRPNTLMWLAVEEGASRRLLGSTETGPLTSAVRVRADARGLPVHLPLLDLEDQTRIRPADVFGDFRDTIMAASARYRAQAVVAARLSREGDQYRGRFTLYQDERTVRWEAMGGLEAVVAAGVDRAADEISLAYSQSSAGAKVSVLMQVGDIGSLDDYVRTTDYLSGLSGISEVQPVAVGAGAVLYRLGLQGGVYALVQAIGLGETLVPTPPPEAGTNEAFPEAELRYRLLQ